MTTSLYCTFFLGRQCYGIPVSDVQEVLSGQPLTQVPLAPAAVAGLMNLRGQIVTAVDLRRVMHVQEARPDHEAMNVVVKHADAEVSLQVDSIGDVLSVDEAALERPPETLQGVTRNFINSIYPMEERLLLILDVSRMLEDESCTKATLA